ncbi:hypothetical protein JTB14_003724 [Gonioctena quinquepunctata]|nr:hypothetical protein JTB14_003724 [Gonioctena quinquepunctata]
MENIFTVFEHGRDLKLPKIKIFSKWIRLIRSTAWALHFKKVFRIPKNNRPRKVKFDVDTLEEASKLWLKNSQGESFEEISLLNRNKTLPKSSRLFELSAFLDETGIIRLGCRFPESESLNLGYDSRYPVILDSKNKYTQMLIDHYHHESGHNGVETVINNSRLKYWIPHIRQAVKKCFNTCLY